MNRAYVALGANLGTPRQTLTAALHALEGDPGTRVVAVSDTYETAPVGGPPGQPPYLNAVAVVETTRGPRALLELLLGVEDELGRVRAERWGPRLVDLDLLLHGDAVVDEPDLIVPHPRARERAFVLVPLVNVDPDAVFPDGERADAALARLDDRDGIRPAGRLPFGHQ